MYCIYTIENVFNYSFCCFSSAGLLNAAIKKNMSVGNVDSWQVGFFVFVLNEGSSCWAKYSHSNFDSMQCVGDWSKTTLYRQHELKLFCDTVPTSAENKRELGNFFFLQKSNFHIPVDSERLCTDLCTHFSKDLCFTVSWQDIRIRTFVWVINLLLL